MALLAATPALTAEQAQTLPVADLAARVLGPAGAVAIDVARPRWPECVGFCPPPEPRPNGPPPLRSLTFYTRAGAVAESGWMGLCRASIVAVYFDDRGAVTGLGSASTIGWLGALTPRLPLTGKPGDLLKLESQQKTFDARCRAMPTTRGFVAGLLGPVEADRVVIAVALIHDSLDKRGPIRVTCDDDCPDRRNLAGHIAVEAISGFQRVDPKSGGYWTGGPLEAGCYRVDLTQGIGFAESLNLCLRTVGDDLTVTRARFSRSNIVY